MNFKQFGYQWISEHVAPQDIRDFLYNVVDLVHLWRLSGVELSQYTSYLFQLLRAWNEYKEYD